MLSASHPTEDLLISGAHGRDRRSVDHPNTGLRHRIADHSVFLLGDPLRVRARFFNLQLKSSPTFY